MSLSSGVKLEPYEVISLLGVGGMGEVYRARDARLGRDVALKILPESFAQDATRLHRFEQEARAVAALNHPNILAVFDIGRHNGSPFLVSELLEGDSLRTVLDHGPLPQRKTIEYGVQIAHGLAAAHEKGIVHRDLKPENVFITRDGRVKVLDFGLAKLAQKTGDGPEEVTFAGSGTAAGIVVGTASYMAPEQVRGEPVDPRTDIFAFGAVLYEMLSGSRAFRRDTAAETMTAVLKDDPPELSDPGRLVSPTLDRIVRRCLEKSPEQRFQSARDLSFALSAFSGSESASAARAAAPAPARGRRLLWLAAVLALLAVAAITWVVARRPAASTRMKFAIPVPEEMSVSHMALSQDGTTLAFISPDENTGLSMIYVQRIGSSTVTLLPGTQNASFPFWSPDGSSIAFFANGKLQKMAIAGGTPQVLASVLAGRGGAWGSENVIIYAPDTASGLWRVNADGGGKAPVTQDVIDLHKEQQTHRWPVFLPDGKHFLYWAGNFTNARDDRVSGIYLGALDSKDQRLVVHCHSSLAYDSENLFFADEQRQLVTIPFDPSTGRTSGNAVPVASEVGFQPSTYWAAFTASLNGTLVYNNGIGAAQSVLTWMDRAGKELGRMGQPGVMANPALSPDGRRVAMDVADLKANNVDIWLMSTGAASNARFTFDPTEDVMGAWSRDGNLLAYRSIVPEGSTVVIKRTNGLEPQKQIMKVISGDDVIPNSWSADGQSILISIQSAGRYYLARVSVADGTVTPLLNNKSNETNGQISPDGKWVAYTSDESGAWEVYVTSFPSAAGKWQVSRGGGGEPRWRGDGKEIFYIAPSGLLMAVPVNAQSDFATGTPVSLFQIHGRAPISSTDLFSYDVTADGKRFVVNRYLKPEHVPPLTILLNVAHTASSQ